MKCRNKIKNRPQSLFCGRLSDLGYAISLRVPVAAELAEQAAASQLLAELALQ